VKRLSDSVERGAPARADHGGGLFRLPPRPARRRPERDRAAPVLDV